MGRQKFGGSEKRTEREIDNLLLQAPLDLKSTVDSLCKSYVDSQNVKIYSDYVAKNQTDCNPKKKLHN